MSGPETGSATVTRRRALRRRGPGLIALLALVVAVGVYLPLTLATPLAPAAAETARYQAPQESSPALTFPPYGATAVKALGYEHSLTTSGDDEPRSIASISKVVTALVVLEAKPLDGGDGPTITIDPAAAALRAQYLQVDGKVAPMSVGQTFTERQMLEVALIESANNYAGALAQWAFGSDAAYAAAATTWLAENGLHATTIVEPTGLSAQNTSTATDLVTLGTLALQNETVSAIVNTASTTVPGVGTIENSNELLGLDGVKGIKTGTLDAAGACLLFAADYRIADTTVTVVGVMLGGKDHPSLDADVQALLGSVTKRFQTLTLTTRGSEFAHYDAPWGASANAVAAQDASVLAWGDETVTASITTDEVGSGARGATVGRVTFSIGDGQKAEVPLRLDRALVEPDAWWRLTHPGVVLGG
ncbi:D-alanyl-D-alanine carboxypeptidase family protein [Frigoribacterium sp. 2-23]|uniref:D-alanyl-D-alanine carboxypeptidase family protein n=1 Tax=Frigoribacterium sp. 2-23 TaxID=3415006 RepID=UPI003C70571E